MSDEPRIVEPDGLYTPGIKRHSLEKIRLHNRYASIFTTAMRDRWPQLAYIGLCAGAGHALLAGSGDTVETSGLAVLRQPHPFTDYIYVDRDPRCVNALRARTDALNPSAKVTILEQDVNHCATQVKGALPAFTKSNGLLSFCFVDPFDLQFRFETIRALSHLRMDFLVLLMLGVDARRNFSTYMNDISSTRIDDLIDCRTWREEFASRHAEKRTNRILFLLGKFDQAMQRVGYLSAAGDAHWVKIDGMGVMQYVLAFYSKDPVGQKFWRQTRASLSPQLGFGL